MNKVNYYRLSKELKQELGQAEKKPRLLLHACCAPCAGWPLEFLADCFDLTIYYNNSNIYPYGEYERRKDELIRYLSEIDIAVNLVIPEYDNERYTQNISIYADEPERGKRCHLCYRLRMDEAMQYAQQKGFDYFTTVMTISRQKDSQVLNEIGLELVKKYPPLQYFVSDFKKQGGQERSQELSRLHHLYRQDYCGCIYSYQKRGNQKEKEGGCDR